MSYVALKPCCFAGQRFKIGESVPDDVIYPGAAKNLVKMKIIAEQNAGTKDGAGATAPSKSTVTLKIRAKEGDLALEPTVNGIQSVFDVLTGKAADADAIIGKMTDGDALILLHITDGRKAIKDAAEIRAKAINKADQESAGEQ